MADSLYRAQAALQPTATELAAWTGGECRDVAEPARRFRGLATLAQAEADDISFVSHPKLKNAALASAAGLLIVPRGLELPGRARVEVAEVWTAVASAMAQLYPRSAPIPGVHPTAAIGAGAKLGKDVSIGAHCVIGENCVIGDRVELGPHCVLDGDCIVGADSRLTANVTLIGVVRIGKRALIHPGAVLGADGFKFEFVNKTFLKIPQMGAVILGDDVEIGANSCVDRAFLNETRIGDGTKIDNLLQVGHNVRIGRHCVLAGGTVLAGSVEIGDFCMIGGQTAIAENIKIGNGCIIGGLSGVMADLPDGSNVQGAPSMPRKEFFRMVAQQMKAGENIKRLRELERKFENAQSFEKPDAD